MPATISPDSRQRAPKQPPGSWCRNCDAVSQFHSPGLAAMATHAEQRVLPYTPEQLFALVADVERYPEFLPWCVGARVKERRADLIVADLIIGFRVFRERFTSRVALDPPRRIDVTYAEGPFRH